MSPHRLTTIFFISLRSRTKSITADSIRFLILNRFENAQICNEKPFITPRKNTKIVFVFNRGSAWDLARGAYDATVDLLVGRGGDILPNSSPTHSTPSASQSRQLGSCPLAPNSDDATPLNKIAGKHHSHRQSMRGRLPNAEFPAISFLSSCAKMYYLILVGDKHCKCHFRCIS